MRTYIKYRKQKRVYILVGADRKPIGVYPNLLAVVRVLLADAPPKFREFFDYNKVAYALSKKGYFYFTKGGTDYGILVFPLIGAFVSSAKKSPSVKP